MSDDVGGPLDQEKLQIFADIDEAAETLTIRAELPANTTGDYDNISLVVRVGELAILSVPATPVTNVSVVFPLATARDLDWHLLRIEDPRSGIALDPDLYVLSGQFFEAITLSAQDFWDKIQENHTRYRSPFLLEVGAKAAFARHVDDFELRAAALVVVSHRHLGRLINGETPEGSDVLSGFLQSSYAVVEQGEALIARDGEATNWRTIRWTVSLASVLGYVALMLDSMPDAERFFAVPVRHISLVRISKASLINMITACFLHGVICHLLGLKERAQASLMAGIDSVPDIVGAQNLYENVWVIGDLINVCRVARQCFITLIRLNIFPENRSQDKYPIDSAQIRTREIWGQLSDILAKGGGGSFLAHIVAHGGN